jgi:hypothetical protein
MAAEAMPTAIASVVISASLVMFENAPLDMLMAPAWLI